MVFHVQTLVQQKCENYIFPDSDIEDSESDYSPFDDENQGSSI